MNNLSSSNKSIYRIKPYTRWWWFADAITCEDIRFQLEWLAENGFGGVEIAWVYPSKPDSKPVKFLSPNWIDLVKYTYKTCLEMNLICDFTFGTLWPFGGSFVQPEYASKTCNGLSSQRIRRSWESAYDNEPGLVIDHLSRKALQEYANHLMKSFNEFLLDPSIPHKRNTCAFFCDSIEIHTKDIWTDGFDELFKSRFGYSILPYMDNIEQDPHRCFEYRQLVSELLLTEFFEPFSEICTNAGMLSRVQAHGALTDILKAFTLCDIPESEALLFDPEFSLIPASAAALAGKPVTSCEAFTTTYGWVPYPNISPHNREEHVEDLKLMADALFASGINHMIWHGMPFNGTHDDNDFYAGVYVGRDGALTPHLKTFNNYMEKISQIMQTGTPMSSIAVYLPVEDLQLLGTIPEERMKPSSYYYWEMQELKMPGEVCAYHPLWISTPFLKDALVEKDTGRIIAGEASFDALYIDALWMTHEALAAVERLASQGALIVMASRPSEPGIHKSSDYQMLLESILRFSVQSSAILGKKIKPFITDLEGQDLPLYFGRRENNAITCFIAHPEAKGLTYPMEYGKALKTKAHTRIFRFSFLVGRKYHSIDHEIVFATGESKLIRIDFSSDAVKVEYVPLPEFKK
jgi:hypothetical protein